MELTGIQNLVFDMGGVIVSVDPGSASQKFAKLTGITRDIIRSWVAEDETFRNYDRGKISEKEFFESVNELLSSELSAKELKEVWASVIVEISPQSVNFLKKLANSFDLYLLSNTNPTHLAKVNELLKKATGEKSIASLFKKSYFSFETGLLKPDPEAYRYLIEDAGIKPSQTLLIDDAQEHIKAANKEGWHTLHLTKPSDLPKEIHI